MAFQRGLGAVRALHLNGYGDPKVSGSLAFPIDAVAAQIKLDPPVPKGVELTELCETPVPVSRKPRTQNEPEWTILGSVYPDALEVAEQVMLAGAEQALRKDADAKVLTVPMAKFGVLRTVDRQEIENLRGISRLVAEYCAQRSE